MEYEISGESKGVVTGGLVCGVIALLWGIISTIACATRIGAGAAPLSL